MTFPRIYLSDVISLIAFVTFTASLTLALVGWLG